MISVVVAPWNSESTLAACVSGIARAAALVAAECAVEIIVVDDGSARPVADDLIGTSGVDLQVIRVAPGGQARVSNTGALHAAGELLVFCDSDMLLNPWTLRDIRRPVRAGRTRSASASGRTSPRLTLASMHLFAATRHLRDLRGFCHIRPPGRSSWWLSRMAYGCIIGCSRLRFLQLGGVDGRFTAWRFSDTEFANRWIASGGVLLPVFTANGLHVRHPPRNPRQWRDAGPSRRRYESGLAEPWPGEQIATSDVLSVRRLPGDRGVSSRPPAVTQWESPVTMPASSLVGDRKLWQEQSGVSAEGDPSRAGAGTARYLLTSPAQRLWRIAEAHAEQGLTTAAASGFLACQVARGGDWYPDVSERLSALPRSDRRVF